MKKNNSGFSILITIIVVVLLAALGVMGLSILTTETQMSVDTMTSAHAFFIAEGGLQYYFEQLQNQSAAWTTPPSKPSGKVLGNGTFTITTANETTNEIDVTSTANVTGLDEGTTVRVATAHFARGASTPMAYDYVLYASTINKGSSPTPSITGTEYPSATIFPTVTFASYQSAAAYNLPGGSSLSGTYTGGVYVSGDVTIGADAVVINGFLVATGSITSTSRNGITINPTAPYPAMIANNNINFTDIRGNSNTINGLIYAGADGSGSVTLSMRSSGPRKLDVSGTVMAPDTITLERNGGTLNVVYNAAIKTSPPPYISGGGGSGAGGMSLWKEI